jgi:hypothetical protein
MTKKSVLRTIAIPLAAIAATYGAVTFVGCSSDEDTPLPPATFRGNVFLDSLISATLATTAPNYKFMHNSASPDGTKMFVVINEADSPQGPVTGTFHMYMLDAAALEDGNVTKLAEGSVDGTLDVTTTFRSNWTADGTKIALAAADSVWVIDATSPTLAPLGHSLMPAGYENHDALPTTDGKYAILALRTEHQTTGHPDPRDGVIQLYNMNTHQVVGNSASVCNTCHSRNTSSSCNGCHSSAITLPSTAGAVLCGLDGVVTRSATAATYSGTIYIAGHGGHFAKLAITIDDSGSAPVIGTPAPRGPTSASSAHGTAGANSLEKVTVSTEKFATGTAGAGTSTRKLHDARLDTSTTPDTIYWSTYNLDAANQAHYGKINVDGTGVVDMPIDVDAAASSPAVAQNAMPIYCASGQTGTAFFPCTMTNKAYITVIPKEDIH